jgi:hypothetical protein
VRCSCRCGVGATYSDKRKTKKHFRILLGVSSAKKSAAPYVLQVLRAHGAEVANIPLVCKSVSQKREELTAITK